MLTQNDTSGFEGKDEDEQKESKKLNEKLRQLREVLYAEHEQKVLVALQAMDTGGKDGANYSPQGAGRHAPWARGLQISPAMILG